MLSWRKPTDHAANQGNQSPKDTDFDIQKALKDTEQNIIARISLESENMMGAVKDLFQAGEATLNPSPPSTNSTSTHHDGGKEPQAQHEAAIAANPPLERMELDEGMEDQTDFERQGSESSHSTPNARKRKFGERPRQEEEDDNENQHLKVLLAAAEEKLKEAEKRSEASAAQAEELEKENAKLCDEVKQHQSTIHESGGKLAEDVPDEKIKQAFRNLRELIQNLVAEFYRLDIRYHPRGLRDDSPDWLKEFEELYNHATDSENLRKRFRGLLFGYLNTDIFGRPIFGHESGNIQNALKELEEKMMAKGLEHFPEIVEWRIRTMKGIATFDGGAKEAENLARITYYDLRPFMRGKGRSGRECFDQLIRLYAASLDLALLMRRSKHIYRVEIQYPGEVYNQAESTALGHWDFCNSNGNSEPNFVYYWVSGGLVKYLEGNPENRIILEKGLLVTSTSIDPVLLAPEPVAPESEHVEPEPAEKPEPAEQPERIEQPGHVEPEPAEQSERVEQPEPEPFEPETVNHEPEPAESQETQE